MIAMTLPVAISTFMEGGSFSCSARDAWHRSTMPSFLLTSSTAALIALPADGFAPLACVYRKSMAGQNA